MLTELPVEIQERVYNGLHVRDRIKLLMALPKACVRRIRVRPHHNEKKLGVLAKAVEKRRVERLSSTMVAFLKEECVEGDPTIGEIGKVFPELLDDDGTDDIAGRIRNGTLTAKDLEGLVDKMYRGLGAVRAAVYQCTPAVFDVLYGSEEVRAWMQMFGGQCFIFNLFNYMNPTLIEYLRSAEMVDGFVWPWDLAYKNIMECRHTWVVPATRKLILEQVPWTTEQLDEIWKNMMEDMNIDAATEVEAHKEARFGLR